MVTSFRELRVYKLARAVAQELFVRSKTWPKEERYALTDQVRRSSRAVGANVAEAWRKRRYPAHPAIAGLTDADAEAAETHARLDAQCDHIIGSLVVMMRDADRWCGPASLAREPASGYAPHTLTLPYSQPR